MRPYRIYSVQDVAKAWGLSPERIRQLLKEQKLRSDYFSYLKPTGNVMHFWAEIPPKRNT